MKNGNLKMVCIMLIAVLMISIIPSFVRADEEKNAVVLEKSNGDKIIYIEGLNLHFQTIKTMQIQVIKAQ